MYKLIFKFNGHIEKSYDIYRLWRFIVSNPNGEYQFFIDYMPIDKEDFLKSFLNNSKDYNDYLILYKFLNETTKITDYA